MGKKEKKTNKKGKKQRSGRKHESVKIWQKYEVSGDSLKRKNRFCPRCGGGTILSNQKNRLYCGKCGYTSFGSGQPVRPHANSQQEKPAEAEKRDETKAEDSKAEEGKQE